MTRILVADGAVPALALGRIFLQRSGCDVLTAESGDVLGRARRSRPDLVLLDAGPPADDAIAEGRRLEADPVLWETPVVYVGWESERPRCDEAGADGYVPRPVSRGVLVATLRRFLPVDERSSSRLATALPVAFAGGGTGGVSYTRDVSTTGMFLLTAKPLEVGRPVRLNIRLHPDDATALCAEGVVVRRVSREHGANGLGVRFGPLDSAARNRLVERFGTP